MKHQNDRGGILVLSEISKPEKDEWGTALDGLNFALTREHQTNDAILKLYELCEKHKDHHSADFLEDNFLEEHVNSIKEITAHICNLNRAGVKEIGEYLFEQQSLN